MLLRYTAFLTGSDLALPCTHIMCYVVMVKLQKMFHALVSCKPHTLSLYQQYIMYLNVYWRWYILQNPGSLALVEVESELDKQ